ncbi:NADH:ubiquinone oxidoreductase kDa subunit [Pholiota conissans]|uniref:NADH:ubiquinone oxidoreductase kDa subunit n=1 Tax=Pholiota conissans TaxID=109636 RepID=A0A9P5YZD3_9AGAR|nr:NADH:ubiquinone oxidoreductase kDa subunit [Pholiota conissans]
MLGRRAFPRLSHAAKAITRSTSSFTSAAVPKTNDAAILNKKNEPVTTLRQAPNYPSTWSTSQSPRPGPESGPRFEQTDMALQPNPLSAMELIAEEPIRLAKGRKAICDGGGGPLGHPKIYINLDQPGPRACGYCGIRFEQDPHHHH